MLSKMDILSILMDFSYKNFTLFLLFLLSTFISCYRLSGDLCCSSLMLERKEMLGKPSLSRRMTCVVYFHVSSF